MGVGCWVRRVLRTKEVKDKTGTGWEMDGWGVSLVGGTGSSLVKYSTGSLGFLDDNFITPGSPQAREGVKKKRGSRCSKAVQQQQLGQCRCQPIRQPRGHHDD